VFTILDYNNNGSISKEEFLQALMPKSVEATRCRKTLGLDNVGNLRYCAENLFEAIDVDGNGTINLDEMAAWWQRKRTRIIQFHILKSTQWQLKLADGIVDRKFTKILSVNTAAMAKRIKTEASNELKKGKDQIDISEKFVVRATNAKEVAADGRGEGSPVQWPENRFVPLPSVFGGLSVPVESYFACPSIGKYYTLAGIVDADYGNEGSSRSEEGIHRRRQETRRYPDDHYDDDFDNDLQNAYQNSRYNMHAATANFDRRPAHAPHLGRTISDPRGSPGNWYFEDRQRRVHGPLSDIKMREELVNKKQLKKDTLIWQGERRPANGGTSMSDYFGPRWQDAFTRTGR